MRFSSPIKTVILIALLVLPAWSGEDRDVYRLVRATCPPQQEVMSLRLLGLDLLEARPDGSVMLIAREGEIAVLENAGIRHEILIPDLESHNEQRLLSDPALGNRDWPDGSMGGYFTNSEVEAILDDWAVQYPHIITPKMSIGTTVEGRDIWAVKISDNPGVDEQEPEISYDSLIHPREVMSLMTVLYYMKNLLEGYGTDPELTYLVDNREIWFVPVHNPDGHVYNEQTNPNGGGMWRKNRRHNGGGIYGVDLARNFSFQWGYNNSGSSPDPNSIAYRGPSPFSEPEAQALRDFLTSRPIVTSWQTHTFTNVYVCPFSYDAVLPYGNDWPVYQEYMRDISRENGYPSGPSADTLGYYANGTPLDWHYGVQGIFCIAPEIGTFDDFFWPPKSRIVPLAEESYFPARYWSWIAGSHVCLVDHTLADENGDGFFSPGEPIDLSLTLRNKGQAGSASHVTVNLSTASHYLTITDYNHDFGYIGSMTSADNGADPLRIVLTDNTPYGETVTIDVGVTFDGYTYFHPVRLVCGVPEIIADSDMESDPGWTVGDTGDDADTGIWERDDPIGTFFGTIPAQPEDDQTASPGSQCFITGNGSTSSDGDDVDGGKTTLKTAVFDLSGVEGAVISYWRWYADLGPVHNNDVFQVDISADVGTSWVNVESLDRTANYWEKVSFDVADLIAPTGQMMMRFIARDDPDDSTCEAGIDDFEIRTYVPPIGLTLVGTPSTGSTVNVAVDAPGDAGSKYILVASRKTWPPVYHGGTLIPVKNDNLFQKSRDPGSKIFWDFTGTLDGAGHSTDPSIRIPANPSLAGLDFYVAAVTLQPGGPPPEIRNVSAPLRIVIQ